MFTRNVKDYATENRMEVSLLLMGNSRKGTQWKDEVTDAVDNKK